VWLLFEIFGVFWRLNRFWDTLEVEDSENALDFN
jgi:hypothetical protein